MYLFLDSSSYIQIGILNEDLSWAHHEIIANRKGSQIIHSVIFSLLEEQGIKARDLKGIFLANGPGSYTGIRVAEGVSQILENEGIPVYSFYHYEVPGFCGTSHYDFYSLAFKGEVFHYHFDGSESFSLIKEDRFLEMDLSGEHQYSLEGNILEKQLDRMYDLYGPKSSAIFSKVLERGKHLPPYYYRSVENEFKLPNS